MTSAKTVRVAVTQQEPAWLNLQESVQKTCRLIIEAKENGAELVSFPEVWIPGYPAWLWDRPCDFELNLKYIQNSLAVKSPEMDRLRECAANNNISVVLGFSENHHDSLYIAQAIIGPDGLIKMHRRKFKPTHMERTLFGDSSGGSLMNVVNAPFGRLGALACWEHIQPLLKYHTITQREQIHVAAWPPLFDYGGGPDLWSMSHEGCKSVSRTYAVESQTFVLHTTAVISQRGVDEMRTSTAPLMNSPGGGTSAIFGPDGRQISIDIPQTEEGIIYADLDMLEIVKAKGFVDSVGHYSRPDMLWLGVDTRERSHLRTHDGKGMYDCSEEVGESVGKVVYEID
ncbi:hypothetical protein IFR05_000869 [Cadophora sp. M221]|nr:hypothetical protein IFR05_000869 [Cadophora sp. M221]